MKKYVFIDAYIGGLGGGQFYVNKKIELLQRDGWSILVVSGSSIAVILENIKKVKPLLIPEVRCYLREIRRKKREKILSLIIDRVGNFDEIIVESNALYSAEWGELLASRLNCKHIIYSLSEINNIYSSYYYKFYNFKHKRKEIAGIFPDSLKKLFFAYKSISDEESYFLSAYGSENTEEYEVPIIDSIQRGDR